MPGSSAYVDAIRHSGRHLLSIINDILDFSRIEAGELELERIDFAPADVLEQVRSIMAPQAASAWPRPAHRAGRRQDLLVVRGDPTRLQQILVNLVGNGLKFTHRGGVTLAVRELPAPGERRHGCASRSRTPASASRRIARPSCSSRSCRPTSSTTRHYGGSGLGPRDLPRLVEAMGGAIGARAASPAGAACSGSSCRSSAATRRGRGPRRRRRRRASRRCGCWWPTTSPINRELLARCSAASGHEVLLAENGAEAVELAARIELRRGADGRADAGDGRHRGHPADPPLPRPPATVPILALTASVMASERQRYLAAGMNRA